MNANEMSIWVRKEMLEALDSYKRLIRLEPDRDTKIQTQGELDGVVLAYGNVLRELEARIEEDAT